MRKMLQTHTRIGKNKTEENSETSVEYKKSVGQLLEIKSRERVKKLGEVFTPPQIVKEMCDFFNEYGAWSNIDSTILEPSCGTGNFLVEILERKLAYCHDIKEGLRALKAIWGIDIMQDNVDESKERMRQIFFGKFDNISSHYKSEVNQILDHNIICGDSLKIMAEWAAGEEN